MSPVTKRFHASKGGKVVLAIIWLIIPHLAHSASVYDLAFTKIDGKPVSLNDYKGDVVVVNFWATWCPPCIKEMPALERLHQELGDKGLSVIAISAGQSASEVTSFLPKLSTPLSFTLLEDPDALSFSELGLKGIPYTYIYDKEGYIVDRISGVREWDSPEYIERFKALLAE